VARRLHKAGKVRWTFKLPMYASARRLAEEGILKMGVRYAHNYVTMLFRGRPATEEYIDVRPPRNPNSS